ncbi:MAG: hypothetical protein ACR2LC_10685 [Pyrinomonadaceae bacterium]
MFCPSCASEERQPNQYCRACGTDLRSVRAALERPDEITASAASARDEIGRAIAAKIKETQSTRDLKRVAEDVLPQIEKFLESPEEKRLRCVRSGVVTASIGLGAALLFGFFAHGDALVLVGAGIVVFLIGLGIILNGLAFTVARKRVPDNSLEALTQKALDQSNIPAVQSTAELAPSNVLPLPKSVTEHTTYRLPEKLPTATPRD